jgi:hypothetical protein
VYQEDLNSDPQEELSHVRNLIGAYTNRPVESYLMILSCMDLKLLLSLYTSGALDQEILHTAKYMSNGNVRSYHEMNCLMESVSGTTATSEQ